MSKDASVSYAVSVSTLLIEASQRFRSDETLPLQNTSNIDNCSVTNNHINAYQGEHLRSEKP